MLYLDLGDINLPVEIGGSYGAVEDGVTVEIHNDVSTKIFVSFDVVGVAVRRKLLFIRRFPSRNGQKLPNLRWQHVFEERGCLILFCRRG